MSIRSSDGKNFRRLARTTGDRVPAVGIRRNKAFYTATGGELSLDLQTLTPQISYQPGQGQLDIRSSAGPMIENLDYYETSSTVIGFPSPGLSAGERLEIVQTFQYSGNLVAQVRPDEYSQVAAVGQTSVTTDFSWPLNQNPSKRHGAIMVYLNGILQQRGDTQDYVEVSIGQANTNQIQFNFSLMGGENISIVRAYQAIDETAASTQFNNTRLTELQEHFAKGFQAFVDEETYRISVPYTQIIKRATIPDLSQDLKVRAGVERIMIDGIYQVQGECGPYGENVWGVVGDERNLIRLVGNYEQNVGTEGAVISVSQNPSGNDYIEIVFYGTGLNLITRHSTSTRDIRVSYDGGSEGANLYPTGASPISGRNYAPNVIINLASWSTPGIHTVKIRSNSGVSYGIDIYGFEILNTSSSNLIVNPGSAFSRGQKLSLLTQSTSLAAKPTALTSSGRGGRVVTYLDTDRTVKQSTTATSAQFTMTNADHTYEDVARNYYWREFGASRNTDDFSQLTGTAAQVGFTLDDGVTSLVGYNVIASTVIPGGGTTGTPIEGFVPSSAVGVYATFTFVGTGLDLKIAGLVSNTDTFAFYLDGNPISIGAAAFNYVGILKIVSGLPYGTHTVKIIRTGITGNAGIISNLIVYQPKKPSIPTGAVELSDYNVMATYVANSTASAENIGTGVLRRSNMREFVYSGAWSPSLSPVAGGALGFQVTSNSTGNYVKHVFYGTGFEWRLTNIGANSSIWTVNVDGSTNLTTSWAPSSSGAGWSGAVSTTSVDKYGAGISGWNASAGQVTTSTSPTTGNGIRVSGLTLGFHTVTISKIGGTGSISHDALDIITPLHAATSSSPKDAQNSLPIGMCSVSDSRLTSPVKSERPRKTWAQAMGVQSNPTYSVASLPISGTSFLVPCPDLSTVINTKGFTKLAISYSVDCSVSAINVTAGFSIYVNGAKVTEIKPFQGYAANAVGTVSDQIIVPVSAGSHKVDVYWGVTNGVTGTIKAVNINRNLIVTEAE